MALKTRSAPATDAVRQSLAALGWLRAQAAQGVEAFFGRLAALAVAAGVQRLVVGGGETSVAVVSALGLRSMGIGVGDRTRCSRPRLILLGFRGSPALCVEAGDHI